MGSYPSRSMQHFAYRNKPCYNAQGPKRNAVAFRASRVADLCTTGIGPALP